MILGQTDLHYPTFFQLHKSLIDETKTPKFWHKQMHSPLEDFTITLSPKLLISTSFLNRISPEES